MNRSVNEQREKRQERQTEGSRPLRNQIHNKHEQQQLKAASQRSSQTVSVPFYVFILWILKFAYEALRGTQQCFQCTVGGLWKDRTDLMDINSQIIAAKVIILWKGGNIRLFQCAISGPTDLLTGAETLADQSISQ